jgi:4-amino-4-deoxy-L-arabinose transferase-like glycosyltransferase
MHESMVQNFTHEQTPIRPAHWCESLRRILTDTRCRWILLVVLLLGAIGRQVYFRFDGLLDLSGDEAHYWHWSTKPDLSYYSKPPLVAWIIGASTSVFGDHMWAVRLPAQLLSILTCLLTYALTRSLFGSERLALGTVMLMHTMPVFIVGSMVMTIDPPFFACFGVATWFLWRAVNGGGAWNWIVVGVAVLVGTLAKYAMPLWFIGVLVWAILEPQRRGILRSIGFWLSVGIGLLGFLPGVVWNIQNDWVTARHVAHQTGLTSTAGSWITNPLLMLATQVGVFGPVLVGVMIARRRDILNDARCRFLFAIGAGFFLVVLLASFRSPPQPNWPVPAYFAWTILAAWLVRGVALDHTSWRRWRGVLVGHVVVGILFGLFVHHSQLLYPIADRIGIKPQSVDAQLVKMRGNAEFGQAVGQALAQLPEGSFVLAPHYQEASLLHFYTPGRPVVMTIGPYLRGSEQRRFSQFDHWQETDLTDPKWIGRDAVYLGSLDAGGVIESSFQHVDRLQDIIIFRKGVEVRVRRLYHLRGFKGISRADSGSY